ncbi:MAG: dihydroorotate dehydrogenase-like protein [Bacteroidales bacterium]|nr:dihydroorotate dehydrogenase-like protein [Bacteroidales bacterium]
MANHSTKYMGFELRSPVIAGSSGLTNSVEKITELEKAGVGAVVLKSLFEEQINYFINKSVAQSESFHSYPEARDYIGNYTKDQNVLDYLNLIRDCKAHVGIPVIASINCISSSEWISFARRIQDAGADALELNIFVLPSDPKRTSVQNEEVYLHILNSIISELKIPVAVKVSYYFSSLSNTLLKLSWTGVKGLVLFNRFFSPDIDIEKFQITATNVFSTPEEIATSLRWVAMLSGRVLCDIAASTGVHHGEGVVKQLLAGAKAVQVVSALYKKGPGIVTEMIDFLDQWMERNRFSTTEEFIGKMSFKKLDNPAAYERVQFMKHFAGIE